MEKLLNKDKNKDKGLDITRIVAFYSVVCVHFFKNTDFYEYSVKGFSMYFMVLLRTLFMISVPLFLILSGYLMSSKVVELTPKSFLHFYKRVIPILLTYYLCTFITFIGRKYLIHEPVGIGTLVSDLFGFNQNSWYIAMYAGLLLLIPYVNFLWNSLNTKQERLFLLIVLSVLTMIPSIFNSFDFKTPGALLKPWLEQKRFMLVPDWWESLYPITYYVIGAYIRKDVEIKEISTGKVFAFLSISLITCTCFNCWKSYSLPFVHGTYDDWGGFENTINSVLVFLLINSIHYNKDNSPILRFLSRITLAAYLMSWMFDTYLYKFVNSRTTIMEERLLYFPLIVPLVIILSQLMGVVVTFIIESIVNKFNKSTNIC